MRLTLFCPHDGHELLFAGNRDMDVCPSCGFYVTGIEMMKNRGRQIQQMITDGVVGTSPPRGEESTA